MKRGVNTKMDGYRTRTLAVHGGESPHEQNRASAPSIVMSSTFHADPGRQFSSQNISDRTPFVYKIWGNPTISQLEEKLVALEGGEACAAFGSGMVAISECIFDRLKIGDHVVMSDICYAACSEIARHILPAY